MCTQLNAIPLNANLSRCSVIRQGQIEYVLSQKKNIEPDIYVSLFQIQAKFTKSSHSGSKKSLDKGINSKTGKVYFMNDNHKNRYENNK